MSRVALAEQERGDGIMSGPAVALVPLAATGDEFAEWNVIIRL